MLNPIIVGASTSTAIHFYNKFAEQEKFGMHAPFFTPACTPTILGGLVATGVFAKTRRITPTICFTTFSLTALALLGIQNSLKDSAKKDHN